MSKLLIDEPPLQVLPKLATKIGLNEALILQQIHYWNEINKQANNNYKHDYYWTFNSLSQWQEQFPFWSSKTIQRTISNLEKMKLVVTGNFNKLKIDRTKWYRVDYEVLSALEASPFGRIDLTNRSEWIEHLDKLGLPLPEINSENNKENNHLHIISENDGHLFSYYEKAYTKHFRKWHPRMRKEKLSELQQVHDFLTGELDITDKSWERLVNYHFYTLNSTNDGNILSFLALNGGFGRVYRYHEDLLNMDGSDPFWAENEEVFVD